MTRRYKILQVIDFLHVGGAERVCVTLSNLLFKAAHEVAVLILVNDGELVNSGIEIDLKGHIIDTKDFSLDLSVNGEILNNEIHNSYTNYIF